jgi:hypothetical protein
MSFSFHVIKHTHISAFDTPLNGKQSRDTYDFSVGMTGKMGKVTCYNMNSLRNLAIQMYHIHTHTYQMQQHMSTLSLIIYEGSQVIHWFHYQDPSYLLHIEPKKKYCLLKQTTMFEYEASQHPGYHRNNSYIHDKPSLEITDNNDWQVMWFSRVSSTKFSDSNWKHVDMYFLKSQNVPS